MLFKELDKLKQTAIMSSIVLRGRVTACLAPPASPKRQVSQKAVLFIALPPSLCISGCECGSPRRQFGACCTGDRLSRGKSGWVRTWETPPVS